MAEDAKPTVTVAEPVVEKAEAPATPAEDVATPKKKLGYNVDAIPKPVTNHDVYMHASLVEQRAHRTATEKLVDAIETLNEKLEKLISANTKTSKS